MNYFFNEETNKYFSRKSGKELFGCARDNCEIHRFGGWDKAKNTITDLLNIISMQDEQIKNLKNAVSLLTQNEIQKWNTKKF